MLIEAYICLALNIYHEARGERPVAQVAVANVVMNRVGAARFPNNVCAVVFQGGELRHQCQFSWYCDGRSDTAWDRQAWELAKTIAQLVLEEELHDVTNGALFYHAPYVSPTWTSAMTEVYQDGAHIFYGAP